MSFVGDIVGGIMGADASREAANMQSDAYGRALNQLSKSYGAQQSALEPYSQQSLQNLARLNYAMYGQTPSAASSTISPESWAAKNYLASHPGAQGQTLYQNPMTGEVSTQVPAYTSSNMGVRGGSLNPLATFSMQDWQESPVAGAYQQAQDAATKNLMESSQAKWLAGGDISGTQLNALSQNLGNLYAQYQPASEEAAYNQWLQQRQNALANISGQINPGVASEIAGYAGQYGSNYGNLQTGLGQAQAQGALGQAAGWGQAAKGFGSLGGNALMAYVLQGGNFMTPYAQAATKR